MALGRELDLFVGAADPTNILTKQTAIKISSLDVSFNIVRSNRATNNKATFKVYNAERDTRNEILKEGNNIIVEAGHTDEKNKALIFAGNITEVFSTRIQGDGVTEIKATTYRSKKKNVATINVSLSYEAGSQLNAVITELATLIGYPLVGIENIDGITLPNGFHFMGTIQSALRAAALITQVNGVSINTDNQEIQLFNIGVPTRASKVLLRYDDGNGNGTLLSIKQNSKSKEWTSKKGNGKGGIGKKILLLETLLDPRFAPNLSVFVDVKEYTGEYVINEVNYYGDNFGGKFNCRLKVQSVA